MSEPTHPTPDPDTDPLLDSGSYIDPSRNDSATAAPESPHHSPPENPEFAPGVVIAAEPISMYVPGEDTAEVTPRPTPRRRSADEMMQRPSWLPEGWTIDLRVRSSGATAGLTDRYYVEPVGQRRFRSKIEVLHFLETGSSKPPKRKQTSGTDTKTSGSPASQKQKKSTPKRKKSDTAQHVRNGVQAGK